MLEVLVIIRIIEPDRDLLVTLLRDAARALTVDRANQDRGTVIGDVVRCAVHTIPHADAGAISRTERGTDRSSHTTGPEIRELDELQNRLGDGPAITAADDPPASGLVLAHDLAGVDAMRWPGFAPCAVLAGYRSLLSVPLSLGGRRRSALSLYAHGPDAFDAAAQFTAKLFGLQAAVVLYDADHAAGLGYAQRASDLVGQAKGILMERFGLNGDDAAGMLVRSAEESGTKVVDAAREITRRAERT